MSNKAQEIKMQELKDMFFYTFGIVPLQNYGVIGDGITDNRLKIQQAIYDAINVKAKYIFVPNGEYYYDNQLFKTNEVIFIGNNVQASIKDIEIRQFPDLWNEAQASSSALIPVGGIILFAGKTIPKNHLTCDGQTVNTADYISLYSILNGVNIETLENIPKTFTIPNLSTGNENTKYIIRAK